MPTVSDTRTFSPNRDEVAVKAFGVEGLFQRWNLHIRTSSAALALLSSAMLTESLSTTQDERAARRSNVEDSWESWSHVAVKAG